jgi:hypothetical protein
LAHWRIGALIFAAAQSAALAATDSCEYIFPNATSAYPGQFFAGRLKDSAGSGYWRSLDDWNYRISDRGCTKWSKTTPKFNMSAEYLGERYDLEFFDSAMNHTNYVEPGRCSQGVSDNAVWQQNSAGMATGGGVVCIAVANSLKKLTLSIPVQTPLNPYPASISGRKSSIELVAKVTAGDRPQPGVAVTFKSEALPLSGGHEHDSATRPPGKVTPEQAVTDVNGEVKLLFQASEVAGTHTVKATCPACANPLASKEIQVKVPALVEMLPDTAKPATYTLVGNTVGFGLNHKSNHWFTTPAGAVLQKVVDAMFMTGWGAVGVNDGSLVWGGLFDIKGGWTPSHDGHRVGTEVDLSVINPRKVTDEQKKKTYAELCKKNNTAFSIQTLWHQDDGYPEHFHMYLDGNGLTSQAKGGPCCARYKTTRAKVDKNGEPVLGKNGKPLQETVALCQETSPR